MATTEVCLKKTCGRAQILGRSIWINFGVAMNRNLVNLAVGLIFAFGASTSFAQYARTLSRSNCATPTLPLLSPITGATFNESVSWDPQFWAGHYVAVTSRHMWSRWIGTSALGYWDDRVEANYYAGNTNSKTWRAWAGKVLTFRWVTVPGTRSGYRWVQGTHIERLPSSTRIATFYTYADNCNLTRW